MFFIPFKRKFPFLTEKKYLFWAILSGDINLARKKENYQKIIKMFKKREEFLQKMLQQESNRFKLTRLLTSNRF